MKDEDKTEDQLINELVKMRQRIAELETLEGQHRQAEEALRISARQWHTTFDSISDAVSIMDLEGKILRCNKGMTKLLGKPFSEVIGRTRWELMHGTSEPIKECPIVRMRETRRRETLVLPVGDRWLNVAVDPLLDEDGSLIGAVHIISDITEHKRAKEKIKNLAKFPSENPDPVIRIAKDGTVLYANAAGLPLLGNWGCGIGQLLPDDWRQLVADVLGSGLNKNITVVCGGRIFSFVFAPIDAGYVNLYARDITKHKQADDALQESEEKYRILTESSLTGIFIHQDGKFIFVNDRFAEIHGYRPQELLGKEYWMLIHPDERGAVKEIVSKRINGEAVLQRYEVRRLRKDGETTWCEMMATRIEYGGKPAIMGNTTDITERKQAEEELVAYQEQLRSLVSQLSLTEEQERRRIATALHDGIGQTLALSKIKLGALRESASSTDLARSVDEIRKLIEQTIQDTRSLIFELSPPILYELGFEAAVENLTEQIQKQHGILCHFENDERSKPLDHDIRVILFQVVRELMANVTKHAQAHNVKVTIRRDDDDIRVNVEDDGVGFDTSKINSHWDITGGFGLFNIRERLDQVGKHFEIKSELGHGTWVSLVVPLKPKSKTTMGK